MRKFATFTEDLHALADWLIACSIRTVAMESTGVYWIALFQILEGPGLEVCLVNARHVKGVPGRKTDIQDCQWLQYLHSVGLLRGSFRPAQAVCAVRSILRHRDTLLKSASRQVLLMQKALTQMNLQLHNVISEITGISGLAIIDAIFLGEREPASLLPATRLGRLLAFSEPDYRLRRTHRGDARAFRFPRAMRGGSLQQIQSPRQSARLRCSLRDAPNPRSRSDGHSGHERRNRAQLLLRSRPANHPFPSSRHFASWLGLCPDNRISGGKILSSKTRNVRCRLANALRVAATTLYRSHSALGDYFRRLRARLGSPAAITAAAHKLARILFAMLCDRRSFDPLLLGILNEKHLRRRQNSLHKYAASLGFELVPIQNLAHGVS